MSDIVERLRERPSRHAAETEDQAKERRQREREEGAAEIERLRAALEDVASTFDDTYSPNSREGRLGRLARAALTQETP
jgi:F0F1-type ATP synthase membrane subunit b/b'